MAVELATAYVRLQPSARGFQAAAEREIGPQLRRASEKAGTDSAAGFGSRFTTGMRGHGRAAAAGLAAGFAGAAILARSAVSAASDVEEAQNKVNVVFGDGADEINRWARTAATRIGQSRRQALDAAGAFGNMFTQLGIGADTAGDMSTQMVELASDFASFHNADITEVLQAQQAAFRGEYDAVQRFVPTINAAAVEQRALEMGLAATSSELDAQDKALATQTLLMEGAGQAAGDFARTSDGLANQQRITQARFADLQAQLGSVLIPVFSKVIEVILQVVDAVQRNWPQIKATFENTINSIVSAWGTYGQPVFDQIRTIIAATVDFISFIWRNFGDEFTAIFMAVWSPLVGMLEGVWSILSGIVQGAIDIIHGIIKTVTSLIRGDWENAWNGIKLVFEGIWTQITGIVEGAIQLVQTAIQTGVDRIKTIWEGVAGIVRFFTDNVYNPIANRVGDLRDAVVNAFQAAVDGVEGAWNLLKNIVKSPINVVIGFYNNGIRRVWNAVISKIPGVGDLGEIATLNKGGWVPGSGNRDTVPAMLTPGEFVVTKDAAKTWGPRVLQALNNASGTVDPGIFGYRQGGYVRSADEALEWARAQHGKPYRFPNVGPDSYDCSGLTSALINYILGLNPHRRRHSSGSVGSDSALARGGGDNDMGLLIGARPPFMTNAQGASVGHMAASLMGVGVEATPPRVRVGSNARGAKASMFNQLFHLPGYGGLSDGDKTIAASVAGLTGMGLSGGKPPLGDLLEKMVNRLPGMIYDFFMKKLPQMIVDAVVSAVSSASDALNPFGSGMDYNRILRDFQTSGSATFANGGRVGRDGPILVGERGPEMLWANRGMYVQSNESLGGGGLVQVDVPILLSLDGDVLDRRSARVAGHLLRQRDDRQLAGSRWP